MRRLPSDDFGPRPVKASLDAVSKRLGMREAQGISRLFARWTEMVGPGIAAHVVPIRLDGQSLVVVVDHPAWATQVRQLGESLLDRVAEETGLSRPDRIEIKVRR